MTNGAEEMDKKLELTRRCLTLISRIAVRGACSPDPQQVVDTLMELSYALFEERHSTGNRLRDLERMHYKLDYIDSTSEEFTARHVLQYAVRSTWN